MVLSMSEILCLDADLRWILVEVLQSLCNFATPVSYMDHNIWKCLILHHAPYYMGEPIPLSSSGCLVGTMSEMASHGIIPGRFLYFSEVLQ